MKNNKRGQGLLLVIAAFLIVAIIVLLTTIGNDKSDKLKVGVILTGNKDDLGWNGMHYNGISYACDKLEAELMIKENVAEGTGACEKAINELASEGAQMIILTSYGYPSEVIDVVKSKPEIAFYAISAECEADNLTSYFGRMYQARYLAGIVSGMKTETDIIGYVAAMPNSEVNRGINAFTLGVKSVNPDAVVNVIWTDTWDDKEKETKATETLVNEAGADLITYHQNQAYVAKAADELGVYSIGYNVAVEGLSEKYLTAAVWEWDSLYYQIIREVIQGKANSEGRLWYGIDSEVVGLSPYSSLIDEEVVKIVETSKEKLIEGPGVFSGVIYDNNGVLRCDEGELIRDEVLLEELDWFVDGVVFYE